MILPHPTVRLLLASSLFACAAFSESLPAGKSQFQLTSADKTIDVFTYRPATFTGGPLLIVVHGMDRNADIYRDNAMILGDRLKALVVAPCFDAKQFSTEAFQRGGVTLGGKAQSQEQWTFTLIIKLVAEVRQREQRPDMPYYLIGHSAGGQFLTRLAAFQPGEAQRIVAGNPGSLLFPTRDMNFQYGFGKLPKELSDDDALRRYLAAPLTLLLGTDDTGDKNLDVSADAMKQGATRIERGRTCYRLAADLARANGWPFNWKLQEAAGVGHSSRTLFADPATLKAFETTVKTAE